MDELEVRNYYDNYVNFQSKTGINLRLYKIYNKLLKNGFKNGMSILEIGCGIGTLTYLIASKNARSKIVATDISSRSIDFATHYLRKFKNVKFVCANSVEFKYDYEFDFIILPDVIEHIPVELHDQLFERIYNCTHDKSKILINIPSPWYQTFLKTNKPDLLQVIDQSVESNLLLNSAYTNKLELLSLESYSIWKPNHDYQFIVFRHRSNFKNFENYSKLITMIDRLKYLIKYRFNIK